MKLIAAFFLVISVCISFANDSEYFSSGSQLFPVKQTTISLKKEILTFRKAADGYISVIVHFEFYNPGPEKEITVGFVSPGPDNVPFEDTSSYIRNFTVIHDGVQLSYKHTTDPLRDTTQFNSLEYYRFDHVYLFNVKFKKGINVIDHIYEYMGRTAIFYEHSYDYILVTGKNWANSAIEDFELNIDLGNNAIMQLTHAFNINTPAPWTIVGHGKSKVYDAKYYDDTVQKNLMFYIKNGYVNLHLYNFKPDNNLSITTYPNLEEYYYSTGSYIQDTFIKMISNLYVYPYNSDDFILAELTDIDLRKMKNYFYAKSGYYFKDEQLRKFFENYEWYIPDPVLKFEDIILTAEELKAIAFIRTEEKSRKERNEMIQKE